MPVTTETEVFALRTLNKEQLIQKIEELKEENNNLENMLGESYSKHDVADMEAENNNLVVENVALKTKIDMELNREIQQLKNPVIHNRDSRCNQFDIRVGYSYVKECLETILLEEELDHFDESDYQEKADFVCEEVARAIDGAINSYITNPVGELQYHILDYVRDKVEVLRDSGHIYEEYPVVNDDE